MGVLSDVSRIHTVMSELEYLATHEVHIGIFSDADSHLLMVARVHEFGVQIAVTPRMRAYLHHIGIHLSPNTTHIDIPERSFMRHTINQKGNLISGMIEQLISEVVAGKLTGKQAMGRLGAYVEDLIQRRIVELDTPPNHPVTVERKGSSNPLVDTGRLTQNITWRVVSR